MPTLERPAQESHDCSNIYLKAKKAGGMRISFQSPPKNLDEKMIYNILRESKMLNCEVLVRDEDGKSTRHRQATAAKTLGYAQPRWTTSST